jgi:hypothetical protein
MSRISSCDLTIANDIYGVSALLERSRPLNRMVRANTYFWPFLTVPLR